MLEKLKKICMQSYRTRALIAVVIVVISLASTRFALFDIITGPTEMDITVDPSVYEGKYVTIEAENILMDYVEHTTTHSRWGVTTSTSVDGDSYIVFNSINDYELNSSIWYFYSIYMPRERLDEMYQLIDETWEYWADETYTVAPPEPVKVTGTCVRLTGELEQYYYETLEEMGMEAGDTDIIYAYTIDSNNLGGTEVPMFWLLTAVGGIALLYLLRVLIHMSSSTYNKRVYKFLQTHPQLSMGTIEADFAHAHQVGKKLWIGRQFTIWVEGININIVENSTLIWGYYFQRTGKNSVSQMRLFDLSKEMYTVSLSKAETETALAYYMSEQPQMVVGYDEEQEKLYNKQFEAFLRIKYHAAMNPNQDPFYGTSYYDPGYTTYTTEDNKDQL